MSTTTTEKTPRTRKAKATEPAPATDGRKRRVKAAPDAKPKAEASEVRSVESQTGGQAGTKVRSLAARAKALASEVPAVVDQLQLPGPASTFGTPVENGRWRLITGRLKRGWKGRPETVIEELFGDEGETIRFESPGSALAYAYKRRVEGGRWYGEIFWPEIASFLQRVYAGNDQA
jgi:hypothetical protein